MAYDEENYNIRKKLDLEQHIPLFSTTTRTTSRSAATVMVYSCLLTWGPSPQQTLHQPLYFYHPDHLGSTAMVTDHEGRITQNVVYIPYGEVFVEERDGSWASPYLFNTKELDEETGLYYYGARYLNPSIALWLSTDPLQGKHPGISPYKYCAGNPVKLVDPDGRDGYEITFIDKNKKETVSYIWYGNRKDDEFEVNSSGESIKFRRLTGDKNA
ncbi:MAG: RHS repeat-associated core domain-containing protein [Paludibacteraceae bacterium]|nr:RHS repeat-associated core domain-containing protein [Paludibacteraceae bacterium]